MEYQRWLVMRDLFMIEMNSSYHRLLEQALFKMIQTRSPNSDPVFRSIQPDDSILKPLDKLIINKFPMNIINRIKKRITIIINDFLKSQTNPQPGEHLIPEITQSQTHVAIKYKEFFFRIPISIWDFLYARYPQSDFKLRILYSAMRWYWFRTGIIPEIYPELYKIGIWREYLCSPFTFHLGLHEYQLKKTHHTGFYSLFPDTDKYFGCLGTKPPENERIYAFYRFTKPESYPGVYISYDYRFKLIQPRWHDLMGFDYYSNPVYLYSDTELNSHSYSHPHPDQTVEYPDFMLDTIDTLTKLHKGSEKDHYEYLNILERLILSISNKEDNYLKQLKRELQEKNLPNQLYSEIISTLNTKTQKKQISYKIFIPKPGETGDHILIQLNEKEWKLPIHQFRIYALMHALNKSNNTLMNALDKPNITLLIKAAIRNLEMLARGQHWNIPFNWHTYLFLNHNYRLEGFSSPFNSQILLLNWLYNPPNPGRFCSINPEYDHPFGSIGSVFDLDKIITEPITMNLNPPYVESLINKMIDLIDILMQKPGIIIYTGIPTWKDAQFYDRLMSNPYVQHVKELTRDEYYYENSASLDYAKIKPQKGYTAFELCVSPIPDSFHALKKLNY